MSTNLKPGGTEGGDAWFLSAAGFLLAAAGLYFFFDSVHVRGGGAGLISGWMGGHGGGMGLWHTTSMGVIFVPFFLGVVWLFYDADKKPAWILMWAGLAIVIVEILSRIRFDFSMKTTHLLLILGMIAAGVGMMIRSFREDASAPSKAAKDKEKGEGQP
jgi:uncharacterized protein